MAEGSNKGPQLDSELAAKIEALMNKKNASEHEAAAADETAAGENASEDETAVTEETADASDLQEEPEPDMHEVPSGGEKKGKGLKTALIIAGIALILFLSGVTATYCMEAKRYESVFFDNTYINNIDVSYKTPEEVKTLIRDLCKDYAINVSSRYRDDEQIKASDVDLVYVTGEEIDGILAAQEPLKFYFAASESKEHDVPAMLDLDGEKLDAVCSSLSAFDDASAVSPENAFVGDYDPNISEYVIVPEKDGNLITDREKAVAFIGEKILCMEPSADLEEIGSTIYPAAEIRSDDQGLQLKKSSLDRYVKTRITFKDSDIVLDGNTIKGWLTVDEDNNVTMDEDKLREFVVSLARDLDTVDTVRYFKSWYGNDTSVSGGTFGWEMDQEAEFNELKSLIPESIVTEREPVYLKRGITHGENDWGDTYVEVNLAKQHLFFIKDGDLVAETDVVSGGLQRKAGTPTGVYCINNKAMNVVLRGPRRSDGTYEYESPVTYWMPFNKGIGLHDASWRGSFGGNIYKYSGSHGCVNLPKKKAKAIYENIDIGVPVIVYDDDFVIVQKETETETETETKAKKKKTAQPQTQPQTRAETQPETQPATEPETAPASETQTQQEVGPAFSQLQTEPEVGPGVRSDGDDSVTYNADNLPGEMQ